MVFNKTLPLDTGAVAAAFGLKSDTLDESSRERLARIGVDLEQAARPLWVWKLFPLGPGARLASGGPALPGRDIAAHLDGCESCILLALTLGGGVENRIRAAGALSVAEEVMLDTAASVLVEQYADEAEDILRTEIQRQGMFITGRFSPGYGDFALDFQPALLRLLEARKAIGLAVTESNILTPRKSITAVLGVAPHPVRGKPAGCATCALRGKCNFQKEGKSCGQADC